MSSISWLTSIPLGRGAIRLDYQHTCVHVFFSILAFKRSQQPVEFSISGMNGSFDHMSTTRTIICPDCVRKIYKMTDLMSSSSCETWLLSDSSWTYTMTIETWPSILCPQLASSTTISNDASTDVTMQKMLGDKLLPNPVDTTKMFVLNTIRNIYKKTMDHFRPAPNYHSNCC